MAFSQRQYGLPAQLPTAVVLGNGDGSFQQAQTFTSPGGALLALDVNRDGKLDLIIGNTIAPGNGDGAFQTLMTLSTRTSGCQGFVCDPTTPFVAGVVADFNADGLPDFALEYATGLPLSAVIGSYINDGPGDGVSIRSVSAATGKAPAAFDSIVSAFGENLAPATEAATTSQLPTTLGGIKVHVGGVTVPLFFVSPSQINYYLPLNVQGPATFTIERVGSPYKEKGILIQGDFTIPGLFSLAGGLAAATAVRLAPDGTQTLVPVVSCSGINCVAVPIDVSGDPVYLSLFGTGFSSIDGKYEPFRATCNGRLTSYFGPQSILPGLSQINWQLPSKLPGGKYNITCGIQGNVRSPPLTNSVSVLIQ